MSAILVSIVFGAAVLNIYTNWRNQSAIAKVRHVGWAGGTPGVWGQRVGEGAGIWCLNSFVWFGDLGMRWCGVAWRGVAWRGVAWLS